MPQSNRLTQFWRRVFGGADGPAELPVEAPQAHVVLLDGTLSSLEEGQETSVGLTFKLLRDDGHDCLYYEPGMEWEGLRGLPGLISGYGINKQIRRAYMFLAHRYRPGDKVFLVGYSRGAYAVRALAGMIDKVGLLRDATLTHDRTREAWSYYCDDADGPAARAFQEELCHAKVSITAVGVYDTVSAVGVKWPVIWRLLPEVHAFHSHRLGPTTENGFQALALHETRRAYAPDRWETRPGDPNRVEQVWFKGGHGDVGGHLSGYLWARPQANVSAVWMLERLQAVGLELPGDWRARFPADETARPVGSWRGFGIFFLWRERREVGLDPSEALHPSAEGDWADGAVPLWSAEAVR
ncbi:DUF2235 domain-containing protein [Jannaschia seohaensis]|uniref:Putative alpha/beta hydrolase family protein DUF2235 n=1 Tax=Jannaschia seohaensis TaxID=475081 RepID=A0A2Y9AKB0_9RHOB|nr:DUF2235 domain-containing protein [Jannaschia seohaensis]PWJ20499.1 putative alpha/beta hydrolase family protein DUF2235 [Jannaschia seohaensis]SSA44595.1 Uncharacterized alpha/beta hydrolase domain [Jannaschia seohaensis]